MIRPMTSNVSALSGVVANGHQAVHFVSSAPSEIPHGGFSPVRLQTRLTPRPPSRAGHHPLIGRYRSYLRPQRLIRSRTGVQAAPRTSDQNRGSSGPWLPNRLCCPAGSSLTMATSAPLPASRRIMVYARQALRSRASGKGSPIYSDSPCAHAAARTPVVPTRACNDGFRTGLRLRPICTGSATTSPTNPDRVGSVTKLQRSLDAMAWCAGWPCSGQDFYDRAFVSRVTPFPTSVMTRCTHRQLPSPDFHRLDCHHYGLQTDGHGSNRRNRTWGRSLGKSLIGAPGGPERKLLSLRNLCPSASICGFDRIDTAKTAGRRAVEHPIETAVLILAVGRAKNRLKPGLRTVLDTTLRGSESRLYSISLSR
jgi:hypothetical protein